MTSTAPAPQFRWTSRPDTPAERDHLAKELNLHPALAQVLAHRGIRSSEEARDFLKPSLQSLPDPTKLPDFEPAIECLAEAVQRGARILVHGDYDVDGTCGSVLLWRLFKLLGAQPTVFIPDRVLDGYSFGERSLQAIREHQAEIVVAVDNGTTAFEPLEQLAKEGIQVIVVDHHPPAEQRPICTALLNPWCAPGADASTGVGSPDLDPWFCGCGVAWLLAWGLLRHVHGEGELPESHRQFLMDALGLAAIATVGDVMPLRGPNRAIVQRGLQQLGGRTFPGLGALLQVANIKGAPTSIDIGFRLGPRLNAAGRMNRAELAFQVLTSESAAEAATLAQQLDELNLDRRETERQETEALAPQAEAQRTAGAGALFIGRPEAHFGVLGIVAARYLDATGLPTLAWAECTPGLCRGSARAPEGLSVMDILNGAAESLSGHGGHARAAGFHFATQDAEKVEQAILAAAAKLPQPDLPQLHLDGELGPNDLSVRDLHQMKSFEPFGEQNPEPLWLAQQMTISRIQPIGQDGTHLALTLERYGDSIRTLCWRMAEHLEGLTTGQIVDVVVTLSLNQFRGRSSVEWTLKDLRVAK